MNIVAHRLGLSSSASPLLVAIRFYASKMQASSTQNNRDSAGKRLGYHGIRTI